MAIKVETLKREFKFGEIVLPDPNPVMSPFAVVEFYSYQYPEMASAVIKPIKSADNSIKSYEIKTKISENG